MQAQSLEDEYFTCKKCKKLNKCCFTKRVPAYLPIGTGVN